MKRDVISIGYSLGILENGQSITGTVETCNEIVTLDFKEFSLWQLVHRYNNMKKLQEKYDEIFNQENSDQVILKLKEKNLIVGVDDDLETVYEKIKNYRLFRQGYGIGRHDGHNNTYIISLNNTKLELDSIEFSLWMYANNNITVEAIYEQFKEMSLMTKEGLILYIFKLYDKHLIYII